MLTQEPIYKPSSIFRFKPILLSAHKLTLAITSAQRDCSKIFITARPSSKSGAAANHRLRHWLLHSVNSTIFVRSIPFVFPKAKA